MIRSFNRLGQLEISQGCIQYQDPNTGLWISDANSPACGSGTGGAGLPADPGAGEALSEWSDLYTATANSSALNAGKSASLVLAEALMAGNIPSPLPGLGVTVPDPTKKWLMIGAVIVGGVLFLSGGRGK